MHALSKKYAKQIAMLILACFIALCFTGCSPLTKDGNFSNPPIRGKLDCAAWDTRSEIEVVVVSNERSADKEVPSSYSSVSFTLVYLDSNNNPLFIDNSAGSRVRIYTDGVLYDASYVYDDAYYEQAQQYGYPQYVHVYISQVNTPQSSKSAWGFSSNGLEQMSDPNYLSAALKALEENAIDCGVAQIR